MNHYYITIYVTFRGYVQRKRMLIIHEGVIQMGKAMGMSEKIYRSTIDKFITS
jgi:hypothetical protein